MKSIGKKLICLLLAALLLTAPALVGCGGGGEGSETPSQSQSKPNKDSEKESESEAECEHVYAATKVVEPNCTTDGHTVYTCSKCNDTYKDDITQKLGHTVTFEKSDYKKPTSSENGIVSYECETCHTKLTYGEIKDADSRVLDYESVTGGVIVKGFKSGYDVKELVIPPVNSSGQLVIGIKEGAFQDNAVLKKVSLPDTLQYIGANAFDGCAELTTVTVGYASVLETIGDSAFYECPKLATFDLPKSLVTVEASAFENCTLLKATNSIYGKLETVGDRAFLGTAILQFSIPATVSYIGNRAFGSCDNLRTLTFAETGVITEIPAYSFEGCADLEELTIPAYITAIGKKAFSGCESLRELTFAEGCKITAIGDEAFYNNVISELHLPATVTTLGAGAFYYSRAMTDLYLPVSLENISDNCFFYAENLTAIHWVGEGEPRLVTIGNEAVRFAFALPTFEVPATVTSIGNNAFSGCSSLETLVIPTNSKLETIGKEAFLLCENLSAVALPGTLVSVGEFAFSETALTTLTFAEGTEALTVEQFAFYGCTELTQVTFPKNLAVLGNSAFGMCDGLTSVTFTEGTVDLTVGRTAFGRCTSLVSVKLPSNLKTISKYAFTRCHDDLVIEGEWESKVDPTEE